MIEFFNNLDTQLFLFFNGLHHDSLDSSVMMFSGRFIWIPMYATILLILLRSFSLKAVIIYTLALVLAITLSDQTGATLIRPLVERLRPANLDNPLSQLVHIVDGYRGGRYGFPSCHAANSFALAMFLSCLINDRRFTIFIFLWAAANSYSRLYLGVHYPGDLLVGGCIGAFFGWLCYRLARLLDPTSREEMDIRLRHPYMLRFPGGILTSRSDNPQYGMTFYYLMPVVFVFTLFYIIFVAITE